MAERIRRRRPKSGRADVVRPRSNGRRTGACIRVLYLLLVHLLVIRCCLRRVFRAIHLDRSCEKRSEENTHNHSADRPICESICLGAYRSAQKNAHSSAQNHAQKEQSNVECAGILGILLICFLSHEASVSDSGRRMNSPACRMLNYRRNRPHRTAREANVKDDGPAPPQFRSSPAVVRPQFRAGSNRNDRW